MHIEPQAIADVLLITAQRRGDERGWFAETFRQSALAEAGFTRAFVQDNQAFSAQRGTMRGLHFQAEPHAQDKLIRVLRGAILDVAVDIRRGSPSYGRRVAVQLSADNANQLLVPRGFAHGYLTLTEDCEVFYKVSAYYAPEAERGLLWSDPALGIDWPIPPEEVRVNARDQAWPTLDALRDVASTEASATPI
jgi:dTDP-4-dehydrorhamnose 3,5-epimerase